MVRTLNQGSNVMSLDFHPQQQTILLGIDAIFWLVCDGLAEHIYIHILPILSFTSLWVCYWSSVGTNVGDIGIWEVGSRERIAHRPFKVWDISNCSMPLQVFFFLFILVPVMVELKTPKGISFGCNIIT